MADRRLFRCRKPYQIVVFTGISLIVANATRAHENPVDATPMATFTSRRSSTARYAALVNSGLASASHCQIHAAKVA